MLRYADRAKQIKNKAVVNESETDKLIRMLKEENDKLRKALEGGVVVEEKKGSLRCLPAYWDDSWYYRSVSGGNR